MAGGDRPADGDAAPVDARDGTDVLPFDLESGTVPGAGTDRARRPVPPADVVDRTAARGAVPERPAR